jgi:formylglycine-generating enzyme required for sulfatase activity
MNDIRYTFHFGGISHELTMIFVEGTGTMPFLFGVEHDKQDISIRDFFISKFPVTQALWKYVMGREVDRSRFKGDDKPAEHVSWNDITGVGGCLEKINAGTILSDINKQYVKNASLRFRLPSETEWEYAARGGKYWKDNFEYSGSNYVDEVAWYKGNSGNETHPVGQKAPNQLGIHDMNGNIWEWCQDHFIRDTNYIPKDGSPFSGDSTDRILRGGCHHNGAIHCRVDKRYEIIPEAADECIGFRLALQIELL